MRYWVKELLLFLGVEKSTTSHQEKLNSALGGFIGVVIIYGASNYLFGQTLSVFIIASVGASAVLVFAVPHGALSQPWPVIGGHMASAGVGVLCAVLINNKLIASASAVSLSILTMYYLRCLHPPGGATALTAVLGSGSHPEPDVWFIVNPVLFNVLLLIVFAFVYHFLLRNQYYPSHSLNRKHTFRKRPDHASTISQEDVIFALQRFDSFIDVSTEDLCELYECALESAKSNDLSYSQARIQAGKFYSNGLLGRRWSIRRVLAVDRSKVVFETVAGANEGECQACSLSDFLQWGQFEVVHQDASWVRNTGTYEPHSWTQ
ncbi:HPP family protein [Litoribacillus peritrichatus]|uniref:HPP transmembrane region domain-containing protein n=1 Tax=Litoribacillus peritrichatus TaxID=718191 RepID=A0ABP7MWG9_9GAMM